MHVDSRAGRDEYQDIGDSGKGGDELQDIGWSLELQTKYLDKDESQTSQKKVDQQEHQYGARLTWTPHESLCPQPSEDIKTETGEECPDPVVHSYEFVYMDLHISVDLYQQASKRWEVSVHCEYDTMWTTANEDSHTILHTYSHLPRGTKIVDPNKRIIINLLAILPPIKVDRINNYIEWIPTITGQFHTTEELRSRPFKILEMQFTIIFYPLGERHGKHSTYFLRTTAKTQHIFQFGVEQEKRCAAHEWGREGAWGFPLFGNQITKRGPVNISLKLLGFLPSVTIQDNVAYWKFEPGQVAPFTKGEEVRSPPFYLHGSELSIYFYPKGTKEGDGEHIALFLKSSQAFAAQLSVGLVGVRSLSHDGQGVWGYPNFCAVTLPDTLTFKVEVLCLRDETEPRKLNVSRSLCEQANLQIPPDIEKVNKLAVLWLGGDASGISRALMAWYFLLLGVDLLWSQNVPEKWVPDHKIIGVATGDDELLIQQDLFAASLGLQQNDPETAFNRQHKYAQREVSEMEYSDFTLASASKENIIAAVKKIGGYPAVLKIPLSDSSAGVSLIYDDCDIDVAIDKTIGPAVFWEKFPVQNVMDEMCVPLRYVYECPRQVLVERLLEGIEYVVNCVSIDGVHCVSDCWVSDTKIPEEETKRPLYDSQFLVDIPDDVLKFTQYILDQCGVRHGASHLECIRWVHGGCRLIELNARLAGDFPRSHNSSDNVEGSEFLTKVGMNQVSLLALAMTNKEEFLQYTKNCGGKPLPLKEHVSAVFLRAKHDSRLRGSGLTKICMLPTFNGLRRAMGQLPVPAPFHPLRLALDPDRGDVEPPRFATIGSAILKTMSLRTCPGVVLLRSADPAKIQKDVETIRHLEENGDLYLQQ